VSAIVVGTAGPLPPSRSLSPAAAPVTATAVIQGLPAPSFDQLYEQGQRRNAAMKTMTARFTETTTSTLLVRPLVARGALAVERPSRVVLRYAQPDARIILIDDRSLTTTWPQKQVYDISAAMDRVMKQFVNGNAATLRREFDIDDSLFTATPGVYSISMVPKRRQIREVLEKLEVGVDRESLLLKSMRMFFASGDTKTMTFEDVVPNATLPEGTFTLNR